MFSIIDFVIELIRLLFDIEKIRRLASVIRNGALLRKPGTSLLIDKTSHFRVFLNFLHSLLHLLIDLNIRSVHLEG